MKGITSEVRRTSSLETIRGNAVKVEGDRASWNGGKELRFASLVPHSTTTCSCHNGKIPGLANVASVR